MLVEKILVHEEDGKLDLEIRLKAPFRDHLDIFENGERTDSILSAEFDYDRLGAIIYGDYYAGKVITDAGMDLCATVKR